VPITGGGPKGQWGPFSLGKEISALGPKTSPGQWADMVFSAGGQNVKLRHWCIPFQTMV